MTSDIKNNEQSQEKLSILKEELWEYNHLYSSKNVL